LRNGFTAEIARGQRSWEAEKVRRWEGGSNRSSKVKPIEAESRRFAVFLKAQREKEKQTFWGQKPQTARIKSIGVRCQPSRRAEKRPV